MSVYRTSSTHIANPYIFTGTEVNMGTDTGASVSLISEKQWARIKESVPQLTMTKTNVPRLSTFADHTIKPLREVHQHREHDTHHHNLQALVVPRHGQNLVGHDWLSVLKLNWATVHHVDSVKGYADLLAWFPKAFGEDIGTLKDVKASIHG